MSRPPRAPLLGLDAPRVWSTEAAFDHLHAQGHADSRRTAERRLHELDLLPAALSLDALRDDSGRAPGRQVLAWEIEQARSRRDRVLFAQLAQMPTGAPDGTWCLHLNDARGARYWVPLETADPQACAPRLAQALRDVQAHLGKALAICPHGKLVETLRRTAWPPGIVACLLGYPAGPPLVQGPAPLPMAQRSPRLARLEAESLHILREAIAEAQRPAMLYSIGKDSSVLLHLARKAFHPAVPPFPLVHIDTRWKFQEMIRFRDETARQLGMELIVHINPEAVARDINPFDHGSAMHTDIAKTQALRQLLQARRFDMVLGGARRDEEKSRAKERIFSLRTHTHRWDPKRQRPEVWNLYNTRTAPGDSLRVFPLSNWTELDIWQYIHQEGIPVVSLYFARRRPVVVRDGQILMVDDDRMRLLPGEQIQARMVRFRTLGCYPLSAAVESTATNLPEVILELCRARVSERAGRAIDADAGASMEQKKQEGYF